MSGALTPITVDGSSLSDTTLPQNTQLSGISASTCQLILGNRFGWSSANVQTNIKYVGMVAEALSESDLSTIAANLTINDDTSPFTATLTPATLSTPTSTSIGATTATLGATTNQGTAGSNNVYGVWSTSNGFSGVTATQVKAGQNAAGSTSGVSNSGAVAVTTTSPSISVTSLTAGTTYYYAIVQNNANGDSNVLTGSFTTATSTRSTSITFRDGSNAALASTSLAWYLTATWGSAVLASGTTSTDAAGALLLAGLSPAAGSYKLFYRLASDENFNGMRPVSLV